MSGEVNDWNDAIAHAISVSDELTETATRFAEMRLVPGGDNTMGEERNELVRAQICATYLLANEVAMTRATLCRVARDLFGRLDDIS